MQRSTNVFSSHPLRFLARQIRASLFTIVLLALGIGLPTAMFSVLDGALLRGLPFPDGERIVSVSTGESVEWPMPKGDFLFLREHQDVFSEMAAFRTFNSVVTRPEVGSKGLTASYVTANLFSMLGVEPAFGRGFVAGDEDPSAPSVAVLSHGAWQSYFGGDPDVLGRAVLLNREPMTVVGVMPEGFQFPVRQQAWAALHWEGRSWSEGGVFGIGKLRTGVAPGVAEAALAPFAARLDEELPLAEGRRVHVSGFVDALVPEEIARSLRLMLWAVLGVLLVASANAASLRLGDALAREHELSVRRALGARTGQILRLLVGEALVVVAVSTAAGVGIAWLLVRFVGRALLRDGMLARLFWVDARLDLRACLFAVAMAAAATLIGGLVPALWSLRRRSLRLGGGATGRATGAAGRAGAVGLGALRLAGLLVAAQIAVCFTLVSGSGLLATSGLRLLSREPGFDPGRLMRTMVNTYQAELESPEARRAFWDALFARLAEDPEIEGATLANGVPWGDRRGVRGVPVRSGPDSAPGPVADLDALPRAELLRVVPGFFETLRLPLLSGRVFEPADASARVEGAGTAAALYPAIVSASFARRHLGRSPLGASVEVFLAPRSPEPVRVTVVGVVADRGQGRAESPFAEDSVYLPWRSADVGGGFLLVRSRGEPGGLIRRIDQGIAAVDPLVATLDDRTYAEDVADHFWVERRLAQLVSAFGVVSLLLSALGLFGVIVLSFEWRRGELAVRSALGARPGDLGALVLREGGLRIALGLALGVGLAWVTHRLLIVFLHGIEPWDPLVTGASAVTVALVLLAAILGPVARAARSDPAELLRSE